jgi:hypothetical protein
MRDIRSMLVVGVTMVALAATPVLLAAPGQTPGANFEEQAGLETIMGTVKEKAEHQLTVEVREEDAREMRIRLTDETRYLKNGQLATLNDVTEGAQVSVTVQRALFGRYTAIEVNILQPPEDPQPEDPQPEDPQPEDPQPEDPQPLAP